MNIFMLVRVTFIIVKNQYLSVKPYVLRKFVLKMPFLRNDAMNWSYGLKNEVTVRNWSEDESLRQVSEFRGQKF